jgi:hypothetical protein
VNLALLRRNINKPEISSTHAADSHDDCNAGPLLGADGWSVQSLLSCLLVRHCAGRLLSIGLQLTLGETSWFRLNGGLCRRCLRRMAMVLLIGKGGFICFRASAGVESWSSFRFMHVEVVAYDRSWRSTYPVSLTCNYARRPSHSTV